MTQGEKDKASDFANSLVEFLSQKGWEDKVKEAHKLGEWNTLHVVTKGKNIKTYLNGQLINDYDGVKYPDKGKIGLQLHSGVHMKMAFKTVKIKTLEGE